MGQDFDARRADHASRWGAASGAALAPAPAPAHNRVSEIGGGGGGCGGEGAAPGFVLQERGEEHKLALGDPVLHRSAVCGAEQENWQQDECD